MGDITMTTFKRLSSFILSLNTTWKKLVSSRRNENPPFVQCRIYFIAFFSMMMMMVDAVAVAVDAGLDKAPV